VYEFDSLLHSLRPGEQYVVSVSDQQPAIVGLQVTPAAQGGNTEADSNGVRNAARNASEAAVTIAGWGSAVKSVDFGFRPDFEIGNYVWRDANGNGVQDATDETPLAGVVVELRANAVDSRGAGDDADRRRRPLQVRLAHVPGDAAADQLRRGDQPDAGGVRRPAPDAGARAAAATAATDSDGVENAATLERVACGAHAVLWRRRLHV
jgi:hypothetical protein